MKGLSFVVGILITALLSGCGSITKMRYSRGYKSNLEWFGKKDASETSPLLPKQAIKKSRPYSYGDTLVIVRKTDSIVFAEGITNTLKPVHVNPKTKRHPIHTLLKAVPQQTTDKKPVEPHIAAGALMFYGGNALTYLIAYIVNLLFLPLFVYLLPIILILAGFIFCMVGWHKFNLAPDEFRGEGLAISVLILFILSVISTAALIAILYLIFI